MLWSFKVLDLFLTQDDTISTHYAKLCTTLCTYVWLLIPCRLTIDKKATGAIPDWTLKYQITQSVIISREGLILTLSILPFPQGRIFWSTPCRNIDAERLSVLHQNSGGIGKSIPSALQISLDPRDFPRASPSGNLSGFRTSFGRWGWISQYLPRLGGARIQSFPAGKDAR